MSQVSHMSQSENQTNITKWKEQKEVKSSNDSRPQNKGKDEIQHPTQTQG